MLHFLIVKSMEFVLDLSGVPQGSYLSHIHDIIFFLIFTLESHSIVAV